MSSDFISCFFFFFFFFNDTATTEIYTPLYTLSLHDALPISFEERRLEGDLGEPGREGRERERSEEHTSELQSHSGISYAVFCLKKKKNAKEFIVVAYVMVGDQQIQAGDVGGGLELFFFTDAAAPEIYTPLYTLSLHDALPISSAAAHRFGEPPRAVTAGLPRAAL